MIPRCSTPRILPDAVSAVTRFFSWAKVRAADPQDARKVRRRKREELLLIGTVYHRGSAEQAVSEVPRPGCRIRNEKSLAPYRDCLGGKYAREQRIVWTEAVSIGAT